MLFLHSCGSPFDVWMSKFRSRFSERTDRDSMTPVWRLCGFSLSAALPGYLELLPSQSCGTEGREEAALRRWSSWRCIKQTHGPCNTQLRLPWTKCHRLFAFDHRNVFSHSSHVWSPRSKCQPAGLTPDRAVFPFLWSAPYHWALLWSLFVFIQVRTHGGLWFLLIFLKWQNSCEIRALYFRPI